MGQPVPGKCYLLPMICSHVGVDGTVVLDIMDKRTMAPIESQYYLRGKDADQLVEARNIEAAVAAWRDAYKQARP